MTYHLTFLPFLSRCCMLASSYLVLLSLVTDEDHRGWNVSLQIACDDMLHDCLTASPFSAMEIMVFIVVLSNSIDFTIIMIVQTFTTFTTFPKTIQFKHSSRFAFYPIAHSYICVGIIDLSILWAIINYLSQYFCIKPFTDGINRSIIVDKLLTSVNSFFSGTVCLQLISAFGLQAEV